MSRKVSLLLIAVLILTSFTAVFATEIKAPEDLKDTKYESAVTELMGKGIISGYTDGTFRPDATITRAEACIIVIKTMGPGEKTLKESAKSSFTDLAGYDWATEYINYAAAKGVISGYGDGTFKPSAKVSYEEMASMLVRALGYSAGELTGTWPDNYISKAMEIGIFADVVFSKNTPALRGDAALMTNAVADSIANGSKPGQDTDFEEEEPALEPVKDADNPFAEFSGRAYGILLDVAQVLNEKGDKVDEYEFILGSRTLYLKTNGKFTSDLGATIDGHLVAGDIYGLQMNNGVVTKFGTSNDGFAALNSPAGFQDFTLVAGVGTWAQVKDVRNMVIETKVAYGGRDIFTVLDDASIYVAKKDNGVITSYEKGTIRDVSEDDFVRLYSVTGDTPGVVEIVLVSE